jgi:hypothetical protein
MRDIINIKIKQNLSGKEQQFLYQYLLENNFSWGYCSLTDWKNLFFASSLPIYIFPTIKDILMEDRDVYDNSKTIVFNGELL